MRCVLSAIKYYNKTMRNLYFGLSGEDVRQLQLNLERLGYADFTPTTFFGFKTHLAMRRFQLDHKLPTTGIFGTTEARLMGVTQTVSNSEKLYRMAVAKVGKDVTPKDEVDDDVSCAFSLDTIYKLTFGSFISGKNAIISTLALKNYLLKSNNFVRVYSEKPGDIVVFPTTEGVFANGHTFIAGENGKWYSNTSKTGLWEQNYTKYTAEYRYMTHGKFPKYIFRVI